MIELQEAAYSNSAGFKTIESEFEKLAKQVIDFYEAMKKRKLDPKSSVDVYKYYYSSLPDKDGVRVSNWNEHTKKIEDIVKKIFKFRSVKIDFQVYSYYGPHTPLGNRIIMDIPVIRKYEGSQSTIYVGSVESQPDLGEISLVKGNIKAKIGYPTELKASKKGVVDAGDGIEVYVKMCIDERLSGREYVAILLHEIGHNIDADIANIQIKNDSQMIDAIKTNTRDSKVKSLSKGLSAIFKILNQKKKRPYQDVLNELAEEMGKSTGYGGNDKRGELYADALPTAYGYGPDLVRALNKLSPDVKSEKGKPNTGLIRAYRSYRDMLKIVSRIDYREQDEHGSNLYRAKTMIKQMKEDLEKTKDSKIKRRLKQNIAETEKLIQEMIDSPENSEEVKKLLQVWVDNMDL